MRVVSKDGTTNFSYENNAFCVIEEEYEEGKTRWAIGVRSLDLAKYMPLANFETKEEAVNALKRMAGFAAQGVTENYVYKL